MFGEQWLQTNYLAAKFPEALFRTRMEDYAVYESRVNRGYDIASSSYVAICGLARDIEQYIPYLYSRVEKLGSMFLEYDVFIVENDSKDSTRTKLDKIAKDNCWWQILGKSKEERVRHEQDKSLGRRIDMAFYRNIYLDKIKSWYNSDLPDYVIILDTDLAGGFSYEGILNSIGYEQPWDFMGSNGLLYRTRDEQMERLYYDSWAYRKYGSWDDTGDAANLLRLERGDEPELIFSCFGGLGIYKWDSIKNLSYNETDCDCVTLHKQMVENGCNLFLNPSQITLYNNHQYCPELK